MNIISPFNWENTISLVDVDGEVINYKLNKNWFNNIVILPNKWTLIQISTLHLDKLKIDEGLLKLIIY